MDSLRLNHPVRKSSPRHCESEELRKSAAKVHELLAPGKKNPEELAEAVCECRSILEKMARPEQSLWKLERQLLPHALTSVDMSLYDLPRSCIPFSPSNVWKNEELSIRLRSGSVSFHTSLIALILDRYVQSSFPLDQISDFYRPAVARLSDCNCYMDAVLSEADYLARVALPHFLLKNGKLLKHSQHKYIRTKTGDALDEKYPEGNKTNASRLKKRIGRSALSMSGIAIDSPEMTGSISDKLGIPLEEQALQKEEPPKASKADLERAININIKSAKDPTYSHEKLPGVEFSKEELEYTISLVLGAQEIILKNGEKPDDEDQDALEMLIGLKEFRKAVEENDSASLMRLGLAVSKVESLVRDLLPRSKDSQAAYRQAAEDFKKARQLINTYRQCKEKKVELKDSILAGLSRMGQIAAVNTETAHFDIALAVLEEMRAPKEEERATIPGEPPQKKKLALPLGNSIIDYALEKALPDKRNESGAVDEKRALTRWVARIIGYYLVNGINDEDIHPLYLETVVKLRGPEKTHLVPAELVHVVGADLGENPLPVERKGYDFSPQAVADAAAILVDSCDISDIPLATPLPPKPVEIPKAVETPEEEKEEITETKINPYAAALSNLLQNEKDLIANVMNEKAVDEFVLSAFMNLNPGRRELLIRQFVSSRWNESGESWREDVQKYRAAAGSIYGTLSLARPTAQQKLEAVADVTSLSLMQKHLVATLFDLRADQVEPRHVKAMRAWLSGDKTTLEEAWGSNYFEPDQMRALAQKMKDPNSRFNESEAKTIAWLYGKTLDSLTYQEYHDPTKAYSLANALEIKKRFWFDTSPEERLRLWRYKKQDLLTAGDIVHKYRYVQNATLNPEEKRLVSEIMGRDITQFSEFTEQEQTTFIRSFTVHTQSQKIGDRTHHLYFDPILNLAAYGPATDKASLLVSARIQSEFDSLLDFFGVDSRPVKAILTNKRSTSVQKFEEEEVDFNGRKITMVQDQYAKYNQDAYSEAEVTMEDGTKIMLDAVFDGMGGHTEGMKNGKPNGTVAANIAKDVFDIAALAGWIRTPEDARKVVIIADIAVVMEQISMKGNRDPYRVNNMGSTMTIGFQQGRKFYGIHCGDSPWEVIRAGQIIAEGVEHSGTFGARCDVRPMAAEAIFSDWVALGADPNALFAQDPRWSEQFNKEVEQRITDILEAHYAQNPKSRPKKNMVCSVIGVAPNYIHINNRDANYEPIILTEGDVLKLNSDGIQVMICPHETANIVDRSQGDFEQARRDFIQLSEERKDLGPHQPNCAKCIPLQGKNDDKTVVIRLAEDGFFAPGLKDRLQKNPRLLASSAEFWRMIDKCGKTASLSVAMEFVNSLIDSAEGAPAQTSSDAKTVALAWVFTIASQRTEPELGEYLARRLDSWGERMALKLRKAQDASPVKMAMLKTLYKMRKTRELEMLLDAANNEIAQSAAAMLGRSLPPPHAASLPGFDNIPSLFKSQTSENGEPLKQYQTRYLDEILLEINESYVVQETAAALRVLPRDLEIMVYYCYSDFNEKVALNPHLDQYGANLNFEISFHLGTGDATRILNSAYLIYLLRETELTAQQAKLMCSRLVELVEGMNNTTPYALKFYNEAMRLKHIHIGAE